MLLHSKYRMNISFYKYYDIHHPIKLRNIIYKSFIKLKILGRIYISHEGINAQISISRKYLNILKIYLSKIHIMFKNIRLNRGLDNKIAFFSLKVKVRNKIVADGLHNNVFDYKNVGIYVKPIFVNNMLENKQFIFVDMRNHYEYIIGHFKNAIHVPGFTFRDQLNGIVGFLEQYQSKKIVLYCTGGIRCEKATAWLKHNHFKYIYHIEGGILNYVNTIRKRKLSMKFYGKNFVFDHRIAEKVSNHILSNCTICGELCDDYINCKNNLCHLLFIQCKQCFLIYNGYCSTFCKNC
ncbi:tRNA uridine(34) hydroxylase [Buchnera aphidicola (Pterocallis alni)]|uniref:oxygen-dependent tRNA uridine(34) hydroxylase TrhO n=1 Tax=Buchnera aphidicola TaxID=9 RepID=UPI003463928A